MKWTLYSILIALTMTNSLLGQQEKYVGLEHQEQSGGCGFNFSLNELKKTDQLIYEQVMELSTTRSTNHNKSEGPYIIPVVFHVLHNNTDDNISDAQIQDAIRILNEDFNASNFDIGEVIDEFQGRIGNVGIEFRLAKIAPNGVCFNGVTRTVRTTTSMDGLQQLNEVIVGNDVYREIWPHYKYLNVIVCNRLPNAYAGYTQLPVGSPTLNINHLRFNTIYILPNYLGSIGTSTVPRGRTLTHEVGHWLNLLHTWGPAEKGVCGDDFVDDTPRTSGHSGCILSSNTCDSTIDNVQNFMDYSYCSRHFTTGQAERMIEALNNNKGGRDQICTEHNLRGVGVIAGDRACAAEIMPEHRKVCKGEVNSYLVDNLLTPIISYNWSFYGGTPSTSTEANPQITYNTAGQFPVTVVITTASGNTTISLRNRIVVEDLLTGYALPYGEGFTGTTFPPVGWGVSNLGETTSWKRNPTVGNAPTSENSAVIDFFTTTSLGAVEELYLPNFNLSNGNEVTFEFDMAYRSINEMRTDRVEVLVSPRCGADYETVFVKHHGHIQTEPISNVPYTSPAVWRKEVIDLTPYIGNDRVRIKFKTSAERFGRLYLDNVNLYADINNKLQISRNSVCSGSTFEIREITNSNTYWLFGLDATPASAEGPGPHLVSYSTPGSKDIRALIDGVSYFETVQVMECLGNDWAENREIKVYPNPTTGMVTIQSTENIQEIRVFDQTGREIFIREGFNEVQSLVDLTLFPLGAYHVQVMTVGQVTHYKIAKK